MSLNIVSFKAPKFKPMPGELTPAVINGATLPVKIGIAQRAIAACCDLSELLTWKDKLAALAAAAKMARMPEMARDVNRVHKEAIFRMGEILLQYNGGPQFQPGKGATASERRTAANNAGIDKITASNAARLAAGSSSLRARILNDDRIPSNARLMAQHAPRRREVIGLAYSDAANILFSGATQEQRMYGKATGSRGMSKAANALKCLDLSVISQLTPEEKQRARKLVVEMQEILDDIDRRLGPDTSIK